MVRIEDTSTASDSSILNDSGNKNYRYNGRHFYHY